MMSARVDHDGHFNQITTRRVADSHIYAKQTHAATSREAPILRYQMGAE